MKDDLLEPFTRGLPDPAGARRFYERLSAGAPSAVRRLEKNRGLLSDVLAIGSFSPLLATTIVQNPGYIGWLAKERKSTAVREKEDLLESLGRFALMNSRLETHVLLSRFRRRELIRIYLKDIRRLGTIAEITAEISNLADAILEYALGIARQELDNRHGIPLETDDKGKSTRAGFCIVSLGKLGSKELNYSSDIDLLFLYSSDGSTSGQGSRGQRTNREYFVKLAEQVSGLVGRQTGEGAAYRVDLRLRPHGRVGPLAVSFNEAVRYYEQTARVWERQVLIRSRPSAGDADIFQEFFEEVRPSVFSVELPVEKALENVRRSKEQIDLERSGVRGFDVKLGRGGIREIEFIAQALQLAYGGSDPWLRAPHTLISLVRLADRGLIGESELTRLSEAYDFLRRLEHRLQMEHGLQTHRVPSEKDKLDTLAIRMGHDSTGGFRDELARHTGHVHAVFTRIFGEQHGRPERRRTEDIHASLDPAAASPRNITPILSSIEKSEEPDELSEETLHILKTFAEVSPPFSEMLAANPNLVGQLPGPDDRPSRKDYRHEIEETLGRAGTFAERLSALRRTWAQIMLRIVFFDIFEKTDLKTIRALQTQLAEACIEAAVSIVRHELEKIPGADLGRFPFAVLGLGKLGGGGMDYGSDLDLVLVYDDDHPSPASDLTRREFYARAAGLFVTTLSSLTRDGSLYRVDLRLRPDGKNGATAIGNRALFNYLNTRSAIWEWLAYVKLRGVGGDPELAAGTESEARRIIHDNALRADPLELRSETARIRHRLEQERSSGRKGREIDIKFGEGGLQDIYFAIRYLQLRDGVPDSPEDRSTQYSLNKLHDAGSLGADNYRSLSEGYGFLSVLDHNLRLTCGRSTRLPLSNRRSLELIAGRMKSGSPGELTEKLTFHRLRIRAAFEEILAG